LNIEAENLGFETPNFIREELDEIVALLKGFLEKRDF
jgi:hypothetical protein